MSTALGRDIATRMARNGDDFGLTAQSLTALSDLVLQHLAHMVQTEPVVRIHGLGSFYHKPEPERVRMMGIQHRRITVPACRRIRFRTSLKLAAE